MSLYSVDPKDFDTTYTYCYAYDIFIINQLLTITIEANTIIKQVELKL